MQAEAAVAERNGEKETRRKEGSESQFVTALAEILGSADPENAFLDALERGIIPDDVGLELAEHLGEIVEAVDFDNRIEVVFALHESEAISEQTKQYLLLAILEMDEQEEISALTETVFSIPEPTPESPAAAPQAPPANYLFSIVQSLVELRTQFGAAEIVPEQKLRQFQLTKEEFESIRQQLGSEVLAQAELEPSRRGKNIPASLEVISLVQAVWEMTKKEEAKDFATAQFLGQRQAELTAAAFAVYEILVREGFRLTHRNGFDRPFMTVSSITLLRNRFRRWLDSHESDPQNQSLRDASGQVGKNELAPAQKAVSTLERFLLAAADDDTKAAIQRDHATRLRERIISSQIRILDAVNEELVAAQPTTKEEALNLLKDYLHAKRSGLASELRTAGFTILSEAEATIQRVLDLYSATTALRREMAELGASSNYDPLAQRPTLTDNEKRSAFLGLERKELDSIRAELETALKEGAEANRNRKKLTILWVVTTSKLRELDQLIAGLQPALEVRHG